jgi:hypothetical protein
VNSSTESPTPKSVVGFRWRWVLRDRSVVAVVVTFASGAGLLLWQVSQLQEELYRDSAIESSRLYAEAIATCRTLYTSEVVTTLSESGIEVSHDYQTRDGTVPLPATLSMLMGKELGRAEFGAETHLYSGYPFP